jgi:hypothetical protein
MSLTQGGQFSVITTPFYWSIFGYHNQSQGDAGVAPGADDSYVFLFRNLFSQRMKKINL